MTATLLAQEFGPAFAELRAARKNRVLAAMERDDVDAIVLGRVGNGKYVAGHRGLWRAVLGSFAKLDPQPESVPINNLVQVEGTPMHGTEALDPLEFVRTIAAARLGSSGPSFSSVSREIPLTHSLTTYARGRPSAFVVVAS